MVTQCTGLLLETLIKGQGAGIRRARAHQPRSKETMTSFLHSSHLGGMLQDRRGNSALLPV